MGNFDKLAEAVLARTKQPSKVSCFLSLEEKLGNLELSIGNLCGNINGCKYRTTLINQGLHEETIEETIRKLSSKTRKLFIPNEATISFLKEKQVTVCFFVKILKLSYYMREVSKLAGGDEEDFLNTLINDTVRDWYYDLDEALKCYYDIYKSKTSYSGT